MCKKSAPLTVILLAPLRIQSWLRPIITSINRSTY